jgi:hypothetical protein
MKNAFSGLVKWAGGPGLYLLIMMLTGAGCASPGYEKGNAAARALAQASAEVQVESRAIDAAVAALKNLVTEPAADLKPQFQAFRTALSQLEAAAVRTTKTGRVITNKSEAYLTEWEKQLGTINYEYIRERSQSRREEVRGQFDTLQRRYQEAQAAVDPLINYLRDIRVALASDLTTGGVEAIRNITANAQDNARKVQTALGNLDSDLQTTSQRLSSQAAPPVK